MYDIEVCILRKISTAELLESKVQTLEGGREAETVYDKKLIRLSLTAIWVLADEDYATFLHELIHTILHEYLHYFFYVNGFPQKEKMIRGLALLSNERLNLNSLPFL